MKIIPAILTNSFESIESLTDSVAETTADIHVDICDGLFVQSKTWPYSNNKTGAIEDNLYVQKLLKEEIGLPHWDTLEYQFDLMIKNPEKTIETWIRLGAGTIFLHPTSFKDAETCVATARSAGSGLVQVGLAVTYDEWEKFKDELSPALSEGVFQIFQAMTIKQIGVQGESFDGRWMEIIPSIKKEFPSLFVQVDGGIHDETIDEVLGAEVDGAVIGSAIFKEGNATENLEYFKSI